jgi:pimeloyl-ACP methyl ester carboxylesterase
VNYIEYGKENSDVIVLLHGGGLSWWNYREVAEELSSDFRVVLPILDGHTESTDDFTSIEDNAARIIRFIEEEFGGSILLIGGLSLGAQIALEILAQKIGQEIDEKNAELEACDIEVPKEYHNEMLAFIEKLDRESTRKEKKQASKRWLRAASIFMICFITLNGAALSTSEAYRQKVFSLFYDEEQGGVNLNFDPGHELLEEWEDYWYPAWIPEGYYLYAAEQIEDSHFLVFFSENM